MALISGKYTLRPTMVTQTVWVEHCAFLDPFNQWRLEVLCRSSGNSWKRLDEACPRVEVNTKSHGILMKLPPLQEELEIAAFGNPGENGLKRMHMGIFGPKPAKGRSWMIFVYFFDATSTAFEKLYENEKRKGHKLLTTRETLLVGNSEEDIKIDLNGLKQGWQIKGSNTKTIKSRDAWISPEDATDYPFCSFEICHVDETRQSFFCEVTASHGTNTAKGEIIAAVKQMPKEANTSQETKSTETDIDPPEVTVTLLRNENLPGKALPFGNDQLPIDILLLTAKDCEFLACLSYLNEGFREMYRKDLGAVYLGDMGEDESKLRIAVMMSQEGVGVPEGCAVVVINAVSVLMPKAVFCVGSFGGLNFNKVKLGDVAISMKLITYAPSKVTVNGIEERGVKVPMKPLLLKLMLKADEGWKAPLKDPKDLEVQVHRGAFLSGPEGIDSDERRNALMTRFPEAVAVEMEGEAANGLSYYNKATSQGDSRYRVMLIGENRSGKSSLVNFPVIKPFNLDKDSTVMINGVNSQICKMWENLGKSGRYSVRNTNGKVILEMEHCAFNGRKNQWNLEVKFRMQDEKFTGTNGRWVNINELYTDAKVQMKHNFVYVTIDSPDENHEFAVLGTPKVNDKKRMQLGLFGEKPVKGNDWKIWAILFEDTMMAFEHVCKIEKGRGRQLLSTLGGLLVTNYSQDIEINLTYMELGWKIKGSKVKGEFPVQEKLMACPDLSFDAADVDYSPTCDKSVD